MDELILGRSTRILAALGSAMSLSACAGDVGEIAQEEPPVAIEQSATTGMNPLIDAFWIASIAPHGGPAGGKFKDIALDGQFYYLLREAGMIERCKTLAAPVFDGNLSSPWAAIKYVPSPTLSWGLIAAKDSTLKIVRKVQQGGLNLGNYPPGVTTIRAIAGAESGNLLKIYVVRPGPPSASPWLLQVGTYQSGSISWELMPRDFAPHNEGLCFAAAKLFSSVNYFTAPFVWWVPPFMTTGGEALSPNTEHAYVFTPAGYNDRFAPRAFAHNASDDNFYGIDDASTGGGPITQNIVRLPRTSLK